MYVAIKGMEMPKNCMSCPFPTVGTDFFYCWAPGQMGVARTFDKAETIPEGCPLCVVSSANAVPTTRSRDTISRQKAIDAVLRLTMIKGRVALDSVVYRIQNLPSAEPQYHNTDGLHQHYEHYHGMENLLAEPQERETGKWMFPYGGKRYKKCSECGRTYCSIPHDSNYCPNCGARMEVEHD